MPIKPPFIITGRGNPICIRPLKSTIALIYSLTDHDNQGRSYYRISASHPWQRLKTQSDYAALNKALDHQKRIHNL